MRNKTSFKVGILYDYRYSQSLLTIRRGVLDTTLCGKVCQ